MASSAYVSRENITESFCSPSHHFKSILFFLTHSKNTLKVMPESLGIHKGCYSGSNKTWIKTSCFLWEREIVSTVGRYMWKELWSVCIIVLLFVEIAFLMLYELVTIYQISVKNIVSLYTCICTYVCIFIYVHVYVLCAYVCMCIVQMWCHSNDKTDRWWENG